MKRPVRIVLIVVGILLLVALILPRLVNVNAFRPKLESELTAALGRPVTVGDLSLSVFSGSMSAANITIADDPAFSRKPFVTAREFKAGVKVAALIFSKTLHVTAITLIEPEVSLLRGPNGTWNFPSLGAATAQADGAKQESGGDSTALVVDRLTIEDGRILVGFANSAEKPHAYDKVNLEVTDFAPKSQFPFKLTASLPGGGDLSLKGKGGPLPAGGAAGTPLEATITVRKLNLAASGFVDASSGIQGLADFDGTLNSDGRQAKAAGSLKVDDWKLAAKGTPARRPLAVKLGAGLDLKASTGTLTQGEVALGKAVANLSGTWQTQGQATALNMKLTANQMPVDEIEAALPALGVALPPGSKLQGGSLTLDMGITGSAQSPVVAGAVRLDGAKLAGFDAISKLAVIPGIGGASSGGKDTTIQNCSTNVRMAPDGTQASDINVNIPSLGQLTGGGTVSPSGALNFDMTAALAGRSDTAIPFLIQGTAADPKFVPNVKAIAGSAIKQAISGKASGDKSSDPIGKIKGIFGKR
jgi:AsmA protein